MSCGDRFKFHAHKKSSTDVAVAISPKSVKMHITIIIDITHSIFIAFDGISNKTYTYAYNLWTVHLVVQYCRKIR